MNIQMDARQPFLISYTNLTDQMTILKVFKRALICEYLNLKPKFFLEKWSMVSVPHSRTLPHARFWQICGASVILLYLHGRLDGRHNGKVDGRHNGRVNGRVVSRVDSRYDVRVDGRHNGRVEGRHNGRVDGRCDGRVDGRCDGRHNGRVDG